MNNIELFSERLNKLLNHRLPKKIKKTELAAKLYVTPQTVSRWCNGVIMPDRSTIELITQKINDLYGFSPDSLERYRSEYLAGEDNIPTYNFVSPAIFDFLHAQSKKKELQHHVNTTINDLTKFLGYDLRKISDVEHFHNYIFEYLKIGIKSYIDNINPIIRKEGE